MCHLQDLYVKYKSKGLVILGFNASDQKKIALEMLRDNRATFPNVLDSSDAAMKVQFQDYRGSGVPLNYIIDREGKIVDAWYGGGREHPKAMAAFRKLGGDLAEAIQQDAEATVKKAAPDVAAAAKRLFEAIRGADYDHDWMKNKDWEHFPAKDVDYTVARNYPGWVRWVCREFKANPIQEVQLGQVFAGVDGHPTVHFALRLKDGKVLQGDLPFRQNAKSKQWTGWKGIDWHLQKAQ
jgi:hypothetical protein